MALGLRRDAKVKIISGIPLFAGLSRKELAQVAAIADELDFKAAAHAPKNRGGKPDDEDVD